MNLNKPKNQKTISEQRENLLKKNNDLVYWIYEIVENQNWKIKLKMKENILTCFPEKFKKLSWIEENDDILILDIKEFRAWNIKILNKNFEEKINSENLTLLSSWVLEILESEYKDKNWEKKKRNHFPTTLRDNWTIWWWIRNCIAGRNSTSDLVWDIEREYSEESPFLWIDKNWVFYLYTPERKDKSQAISDLKGSIEFFLEEKYLKNPEENQEVKKLFEKNFRYKIKYEDLENILKEIVKNKRFKFFKTEVLENFEGIEIKNIEMLDEKWNVVSSWNFFVNENNSVNTIEYLQLRKIFLPKEILSPSSRFYLESQNQGSKNQKLENLAKEKILPVMRSFVEKVLGKIKS